jgi:hypothetical protein
MHSIIPAAVDPPPAPIPLALTHPKCARRASKFLFVASLEMRAYGAPT